MCVCVSMYVSIYYMYIQMYYLLLRGPPCGKAVTCAQREPRRSHHDVPPCVFEREREREREKEKCYNVVNTHIYTHSFSEGERERVSVYVCVYNIILYNTYVY